MTQNEQFPKLGVQFVRTVALDWKPTAPLSTSFCKGSHDDQAALLHRSRHLVETSQRCNKNGTRQ
jgi:hypothetical protein